MEYISDLYNNMSEYFSSVTTDINLNNKSLFLSKINVQEPSEEEILKFIEDVKDEIKFEKEYRILESRFRKLNDEIREIDNLLSIEEKENEEENEEDNNNDDDPSGIIPVLT